MFGLIAATGLRLGEAIGLDRADADLDNGLLTIRGTKSGRDRLVPLHATVTSALSGYAQRRGQLCPHPATTRFFVSAAGTPVHERLADLAFAQLTSGLSLRTADRQPRIHDLRHTFAVRQLLQWHRDGADVNAKMPVLSAYLGHVSPAGTYWYLTAVPELMELAAARLTKAGPQ
jgi:integrase/recombinase XerD